MTTIDNITDLCKNYENAVGIRCEFIEIDNKEEYVNCCSLCKKVNKINGDYNHCMEIFEYSYYQAERFGGQYIFFCSIGLVHWCSSLQLDDGRRGIVLGGPITMIDPNEFIEDEIFDTIKNLKEDTKIELYNLAKKIPRVEPNRVTSLSIVLKNLIDNGRLNRRKKRELNSLFVDNVQMIKDSIDRKVEVYPLEKEKQLIRYIKDGQEKKAKAVLNEILAHLFVIEGININMLRSRMFELVVLISRGIIEIGVEMDDVFGINCFLLEDLSEIEDLDELLAWSTNILNKFMDISFRFNTIQNKDTIFKAISYIKLNYMKKLALEDVANYVYLSPTYFSSLFKKQAKMSFSDYLNKVRIENSKKLLEDNSIKLIDISYVVGFDSQSYFTKVFKKLEGQTPKQYRQKNIGI